MVMTVLMQESAPVIEHGPSVIGPERFPRTRFTRKRPDYPFGGDGPISKMGHPAFQKFITRSRSFCLRVSGAVAPSAFAFGFGRQVGFRQKQTSPARDRVVASPAAPPADGDVAKHHKGGGP